jgi:hypothetical protein
MDADFTAVNASFFASAAAERFLADGFCRIDEAIDADELALLRGLYDWCFSPDAEGEVDRKALGGVDEHGRQALPQVLFPSKALPELAGLRYLRRLERIARAVFEDEVELRGEHMILKPAGYGVATPWHQDQAYHDPAFIHRSINFWLPLEGASVESGCLQFIPGSHRAPILPHGHLVPGDPQTAMVAPGQEYWSLNATAVPCPERSCSLHHSYMLHAAGPNLTDRPRRAYIAVFGCRPLPARRPWRLPWRENPAA